MTPDSLEAVVIRTGHERLRWLTSDDNPDVAQREAYRELVARLASGVEYPTLREQAVNLAGAVMRFITSGGATVSQEEFDRRRAICEACEFMDREQNRCRKCACYLAVKPWGKAESCPIGRWD